MADAQDQRRILLKKFAGTGAMPWLPDLPEYRPMRGRFGRRSIRSAKQKAEKIQASAPGSAHHLAIPSQGAPSIAPATSAFHLPLVELLHKKLKRASLRKSRKMGNRGSNGNAPSPDKNPPDSSGVKPAIKSKGSSKPSKEATKNAKNASKETKEVEKDSGPAKRPTSFSPKSSSFGSESGDSLMSSGSQQSNNLIDIRIESTPSPDTSSVSSSLFVDVQEKFDSSEDQGNIADQSSALDADFISPVFSPRPAESPDSLPQTPSEDLPLPEICEETQQEDLKPPVEPPVQLSVQAPVATEEEAEEEDNFDDFSFHDTQDDVTTDSSADHSPLKSYCSPERRFDVTRSCPGTPDTHHAKENNSLFFQSRERKGSLGNMSRSVLPTIGSIPMLNNQNRDDILPEEDELRNFKGSTQSVHRCQTPHRPRYRNSFSSSTRRDRSFSELCLITKPATVPQVVRRYGSQNLLTPNGEFQRIHDCNIRRVSSLILDKKTIKKHVEKPKYLPQELDFSLYEKFQGQMLVNWFASAFSEDHPLSKHEIRLMAAQFCTNLLYAGVLRHVDSENEGNLFRPDQMYVWSKLEQSAVPSAYATPGRLSPSAWPPNKPTLSPAYSEKELREVIADLHDSRIPKGHEKSSVFNLKPGRRIGEYEERVARLELQLEKYQTLSEIEELTRRAKYISCPTSPQTPCAATQTEPPRPTLSSSSQYDLASCASMLTRSRYIQTESIRSWSRSVQTESGSPLSRNSVRVQTEDTGPDVIRGLPRAHSELSEILPSLVTDRKPYFYRPSGSVSSFSLSSSTLLSEEQDLRTETCSFRPLPECSHCHQIETLTAATQTEHIINDNDSTKVEDNCTELKLLSLQFEQSLSKTESSLLSTSTIIPPPPPMPGTTISSTSYSSILPMLGSSIPPPLPMPVSSIPPPPMPGSSIPPPPPMPGSSIPPPPPMPGSSIPPPPPMPGCGPPPPPPMPGCGLPPSMMQMPVQVYIKRKPPMQPKKQMRPLYWTRIQINMPATAKKEVGECLWENLEETPPESWDEFENLFSKQVVQKKTPVEKEKTTQNKAKEVAKLLDQKRSQNVGILISSLHLEIAEIEHALYSFDTSTVSTDTLQSVYDIRPTPDELQTISSHRTAHPDVPLDKPERFLWELSQIPEYAIRVECIMFHASFSENLFQIEHRLDNLKLMCECLVGKNVQKVISIVLSLGNYMNGGNGNRGQADGFGLEILSKLRDVKSKDNSLTLLHYIVRIYCTKFEMEIKPEECHLPLPEPSDIERAGNVDFDDCQRELDKLYVQTSACERKVSKILANSSEEQKKPLKNVMETFLVKAFAETRLQMDNLERCKVSFRNTQKFYRFQPKSNNESEWPKEFFSQWTTFCLDFKNVWKKEQQMRIQKKHDKLRKKVQDITAEKRPNNFVSKTIAPAGLKAKLMRVSRRIQPAQLAT